MLQQHKCITDSRPSRTQLYSLLLSITPTELLILFSFFFLHMPLILLPTPDQIRIDCCVAELAQKDQNNATT